MSYCLNPDCDRPQNPKDSKFCQNCGAKLLLHDRYLALQLIGQGGFGRTFLAIDESRSTKPRCVIKQLLPQAQGTANTKKAAELFEQEAERLKELGNHPQIPQLLAYFTQDNRQYLVQEFIGGQNLEQALKAQGAFSETQIKALLANLLPVLAFIHDRNLIHRDIKPANIIDRGDGQLVLVDFGAAKYVTGTALQRTGTVIGSAGYAAPEQAGGKAVFASDIYSLGVTCIHLLTETEPFDLYSFSEATWVWRDYLRAPISRQLVRLLDKMLAIPINQRYPSASAVLQDLRPQLHPDATPLGATPSPPPPPQRKEGQWRCDRTLAGYAWSVHSVAISPDGRLLASSSRETTVKLWQLDTGRELRSLKGHTDAVNAVAISPDGRLLASGSDDTTIKLWWLRRGREIRTLGSWFSGHSAAVTALAISPDSQILASGSNDSTIKIWQLRTGKELHTFNVTSDWYAGIQALAISPDGQLLASGGDDGVIQMWQPITGKALGTLKGHTGTIHSLTFSPNGEVLVSGSSDGTLKRWELRQAREVRTLTVNSRTVVAVRSVAISPDGQLLASGSDDYFIRLWHLETGKPISKLKGHAGAINSLTFSPDGQLLASGSRDGTIKIWRCN